MQKGIMNRKSLGIILFLLFYSSFQCERGTYKSIPPELKDKIVFLCSGSICTINSDGTDLKVILPSERNGPFSNPQWSPDKRRIACNGQTESKRGRIVLFDADGSDEKVIDLPGRKKNFISSLFRRREEWTQYNLRFLGWSSSGKYIAYDQPGYRLDGASFGLMTTKGKPIASFVGDHPSFGQNDILVYQGSLGGPSLEELGIIRYDLESKRVVNLTDRRIGRFTTYAPFISPNGKMIAFKLQGPVENELWIMHSDGSNKKKLIVMGKDYQIKGFVFLRFSPDGNRIMLIPRGGYRSQIFIINSDGTGLRAITDNIVEETKSASWSPDGKRIVFTSDKDGNDELYLVNVNGTGLMRLTNNSSEDCCPDW
jgi:Tol biopolymer transport system component